MARPSCVECYKNSILCKSSSAIVIPIISMKPFVDSPISTLALSERMMKVDSAAFLDQHLFLEDVDFINYSLNYENNVTMCGDNVVFRMGEIMPDGGVNVHLDRVRNFNVGNDALLALADPSLSLMGYFYKIIILLIS